jgi:hypothetical protein
MHFSGGRLTPEIGDCEYGFSLAYQLNRLWTIRHGYRFFQHDGHAVPGRGGLWNKMMAVKHMTRDTSCDVSGAPPRSTRRHSTAGANRPQACAEDCLIR